MAESTKLLAFGKAEGRTAEALLENVLDECCELGVDKEAIRGEAVPLEPLGPAVEASTAHLFAEAGPLLPGDAPDIMLTLWLPNPSGATLIDRAWPGSSNYLVAESVNLDGPATGVCRVAIVTRNPALSRSEFWDYWNGHHAPLVIEHVPLFWRYVNNLVLDDSAPIDGITQQWFPDFNAISEHDRLNAEQKPEVAADIPRFVRRAQQMIAGGVAWRSERVCSWSTCGMAHASSSHI